MATYKVIQDIEAEDKLVGPLTLRQFIYAGIALFFLYLCFYAVTKKVPFLIAFFLPPALFTGFLAVPWHGDQPTEVWALAKLRFFVKPRRRIWDQSGAKELVTITVPKKVERTLTNGLSETEVRSRLRALSDTIDSHGWAIKNVNVNLSAAAPSAYSSSDRLVDASILPQEVSNIDVRASDDILDPTQNPLAQQFDTMIQDASAAQRQQLVSQLQQTPATSSTSPTTATAAAAPPPMAQSQSDYWFMQTPGSTPGAATTQAPISATAQVQMAANPPSATPGVATAVPPSTSMPQAAADPTAEEAALIARFKAASDDHNIADSRLKHIKTPDEIAREEQQKAATEQVRLAQEQAEQAAKAQVTSDAQAAIINLASNDDLDVATIARQARKERANIHDGEVVISLR